MSFDVDIFVDSDESVETFGQQIEQIFGLKLESDVTKVGLNPHSQVYYYVDPFEQYSFWISQLEKGAYADEGTMLFSTYTYCFQIRVNAETKPEMLKRSIELAHVIFDRLKVSGRYRLLASENLDRKLDQYDPPETNK